MEHSEHDLNCWKPCLVVDPDRDPASVIADRNRIILVDIDLDLIAVTGKRLVYGVVHDLIHEMMEPSCGSASDIHPRSLSYSFQAFQDLDLVRPIFSVKFCT